MRRTGDRVFDNAVVGRKVTRNKVVFAVARRRGNEPDAVFNAAHDIEIGRQRPHLLGCIEERHMVARQIKPARPEPQRLFDQSHRLYLPRRPGGEVELIQPALFARDAQRPAHAGKVDGLPPRLQNVHHDKG